MEKKSVKRKQELSDEVKQAVDDLLNGTGTGSKEEWLQREYIRLMRREASYKRTEKLESESKLKKDMNEKNGKYSEQDRPNK